MPAVIQEDSHESLWVTLANKLASFYKNKQLLHGKPG